MAEIIGVNNRLCIAPASGTGPGTAELVFLEGSTLGLEESFIDPGGLRGTRDRVSERVRQGIRQVQGNILMAPTAIELDSLLAVITGGTKTANVFALTEALPAFYLGLLRDTAGLYGYTGNVVSRATFSASEGGLLQVGMETIGVDETGPSGSFPAISDDITTQPYVMTDCVLTAGGTAYAFRQFSLSIDNVLDVKHNNSLTPTSIRPTDRNVNVEVTYPLGTASALYGSAVAGVSLSAVFTNGLNSLTITCPAVAAPRAQLPAGVRGPIDLPWRGVARRLSTTASVSFTNVS